MLAVVFSPVMMTVFLVGIHVETEHKRHEQDYKALTFGSFCADAFPNAFLAAFETFLEQNISFANF